MKKTFRYKQLVYVHILLDEYIPTHVHTYRHTKFYIHKCCFEFYELF